MITLENEKRKLKFKCFKISHCLELFTDKIPVWLLYWIWLPLPCDVVDVVVAVTEPVVTRCGCAAPAPCTNAVVTPDWDAACAFCGRFCCCCVSAEVEGPGSGWLCTWDCVCCWASPGPGAVRDNGLFVSSTAPSSCPGADGRSRASLNHLSAICLASSLIILLCLASARHLMQKHNLNNDAIEPRVAFINFLKVLFFK